jgi:hypothetical protein
MRGRRSDLGLAAAHVKSRARCRRLDVGLAEVRAARWLTSPDRKIPRRIRIRIHLALIAETARSSGEWPPPRGPSLYS